MPDPRGSRNAQAALRTAKPFLGYRPSRTGPLRVFTVVILALVYVGAFWWAAERTTRLALELGVPTWTVPSATSPASSTPVPATFPASVPGLATVPSSALIDPAATYGVTVIEPTATPVDQWALDEVPPPWPVNCDNAWAWDGYRVPDFDGYCVPGVLSQATLNAQFPRDFYGTLSSYGPYAMEPAEDRWRVARGHGVALTTCGMMGFTVFLRLPGEAWRGPFRVVDCGAPAHIFHQIAVDGLAVEIGFSVAQTWVPAAPRVDVHIGSYPGNGWAGVYLASWWVHHALAWETGYPLLQHTITRSDGTTYLWPELE